MFGATNRRIWIVALEIIGRAVLLSVETHAAAVQTVEVNATPLPPVAVRAKREPVTVYALENV